MPFIQINLLEGRSQEKKEQLIQEITQTTASILDVPIQTIRIMINEMPPAHWGIGGESVKKRQANERECKTDGRNQHTTARG